jgi:hypothetical protein
VALLERWFELVSGSITLDGVDIRQLDVHWLRKQIGLVQQVFIGTLGSFSSTVTCPVADNDLFLSRSLRFFKAQSIPMFPVV